MTNPLEVPMTLGYVAIDQGDPYPAWYITNQRWNGFHLPYFDKGTAEAVMERSYGEGNWHYSKNQDVFVGIFEDSDEPDEWGSVDINVGGMIYHTYPIGAGSWVWSDVDCYLCNQPLKVGQEIGTKSGDNGYYLNSFHLDCNRERTRRERRVIEQQDTIDNTIWEAVVACAGKELDWDIEVIGDVRDIIASYLTQKGVIENEEEFYPTLGE